MPLFKKLATLAAAAAAARSYAKKNPDKAAGYVDQAARFVDKQTKGKYSSQITGAARKAKDAAGIDRTRGAGPAANGYVSGAGPTPGYGTTTGTTGTTQPGQTHPGRPTP
jgi:hypothetical protein